MSHPAEGDIRRADGIMQRNATVDTTARTSNRPAKGPTDAKASALGKSRKIAGRGSPSYITSPQDMNSSNTLPFISRTDGIAKLNQFVVKARPTFGTNVTLVVAQACPELCNILKKMYTVYTRQEACCNL